MSPLQGSGDVAGRYPGRCPELKNDAPSGLKTNSPQVSCASRLAYMAWRELLGDDGSQFPKAGPKYSDEPIFLLGWSLGAILALRIALQNAGKIAGVVMVSGTARFTAEGEYPGAEARGLRAMQLRLRKDRAGVLEDFARRCLMPEDRPEAEKAYLEQANRWETADLLCGLEALGRLDLRNDLAAVTCPVLLLHGSADAVVPLESAQYLAQKLTHGGLRVLEGRGHALPLTAGEIVGTMVQEFVDEHSRHS